MIRTVLIDDEKKAIDNLRILLTEFCKDIEIVGTASSIKDGLCVIKSKTPDLVFLDVEMPYGTGFDLLSQLNVIDFQVIFVTAYNQYALQAIKCNALDYILKPIDIDELKDGQILTFNKDRFDKIQNILKEIHIEYGQKLNLSDIISTHDILSFVDVDIEDDEILQKAIDAAIKQLNKMDMASKPNT